MLHKVGEERGLTPQQIYNADETGKCLPQRTLVSSHQKICFRIQGSKGHAMSFVNIIVSLIVIFSIIRTLNCPDYLQCTQVPKSPDNQGLTVLDYN